MTNRQGETLGSRMKAARLRAKLTPEQVAARITEKTGASVTARTIAKWESDEVDVPSSRVVEFADATGCAPGSLMPRATV